MISQFDDLLVIHNGTSFYCGAWNNVFCTFSEAGYVCPQFYNISEFGNIRICYYLKNAKEKQGMTILTNFLLSSYTPVNALYR